MWAAFLTERRDVVLFFTGRPPHTSVSRARRGEHDAMRAMRSAAATPKGQNGLQRLAAGASSSNSGKELASTSAASTGKGALWALMVLAWLTVAGGLDVSPGDPNWKASVEAAPVGTTVTFLPGVYHGCNVTIPPGFHPKAVCLCLQPPIHRGRGASGQILPYAGLDRVLCWQR